jgi:hypothetical protein
VDARMMARRRHGPVINYGHAHFELNLG